MHFGIFIGFFKNFPGILFNLSHFLNLVIKDKIPETILKLCKKGKLYDAAGMIREEIFDVLYKNAKKDKLVVRLHDGDPSIYGAIKEQIDDYKKKELSMT